MMVWNKFDNLLQNKRELPKVSCVYAMYFDDKLVYIGSTKDLRNRYCGREIRYGFAKNIHTRWGSFKDDTKITLKYKPVKNFNRLGLLKNQIVLADDFDEWPEDIAVKFGIKD